MVSNNRFTQTYKLGEIFLHSCFILIVQIYDFRYCPSCKNDENEIVKAGGKLKVSKKKTPASTSSSKRDWGKGMACVARTKECKIVPSNHFGPIPGIEVGTCWLFRVQVL